MSDSESAVSPVGQPPGGTQEPGATTDRTITPTMEPLSPDNISVDISSGPELSPEAGREGSTSEAERRGSGEERRDSWEIRGSGDERRGSGGRHHIVTQSSLEHIPSALDWEEVSRL